MGIDGTRTSQTLTGVCLVRVNGGWGVGVVAVERFTCRDRAHRGQEFGDTGHLDSRGKP